MAPKQQRIVVQKADPRRPAPKGYFSTAYSTLTSPENASVVRSVAVFGVCYSLVICGVVWEMVGLGAES